ncbi:glycosyltransferase family 2 protein [Gracilimonas amylolytica]|uniref:glycosyltransferase family 2 protein n=1 Tax=Gracilimonas amylolytica TaxID=1749045 RepID=UPI000CD955A0|nr:glycosyltransferase family 2 protein [Gracilimonas amylolytica]
MSDIPLPDISIIIVNYKVKEYVKGLLESIEKAKGDFDIEIFVVDNDSGDDSSTYLRQYFPNVTYIDNSTNVGFGRANNQVISKAKGSYTFIINPDTVISEDLFTTLTGHMESHPKCGAAGVKILNPDGTFAPESKRSVPTIWSSFCKMFSLHELFPKKKLFNQYYMNWLNENEKNEVPVLSGSCMFWRTDLLKDLGGFDERFFMYGEDIDLCYRVQDTDFHIDYVPDTNIIHYKGESTKKGDLRYNWIFNKALYQFYDKHYSTKYSLFFKGFIYVAIWIKTISSEIARVFKKGEARVTPP